jgi:hypothetical protein
MAEGKTIDPRVIAEIAGRYVAHNTVAPGELPNIIAIIHRSRAGSGNSRSLPRLPNPQSPSTDRTHRISSSALNAGGAARCSAGTLQRRTNSRRRNIALDGD